MKEIVSESIQVRPFYCSHSLAELLTQTEIIMNELSGKSSRDDYNCPVCLNILSNPVVLSCAHRFCWHCLAKASLFGQCCPVCRKQQTLDPRHYNIDSALQNFVKQHFPAESTSGTPIGADMSLDSDTLEAAQRVADDDRVDDIVKKVQSGAALEDVMETLTVKEAAGMDVDFRFPIQIDSFARLLRHCGSGNIIILDLDETVVMTPTTSLLFSHEGIRAFESYIHRIPIDTPSKTQHCQRLQAILDDKVPVEHITTSVIRQLQEQGCWVMGCTARYASMVPRTQHTLTAIGVDLNINAPFPAGRALQDPDTQAVYANGVIFTNAADKGEVLNSFFENVVFRGVHREKAEDGSLRWSQPVPNEIVFVDDRLSNAESVLRGLHVVQKMDIPVTAYHYVGASVRTQRVDLSDPNTRASMLLQLQITAFLDSQGTVLLTDDAAERMLPRC